MKLEDQVVSLDLAKKLKELGVRQESVYAFHDVEKEDATLVQIGNNSQKWSNQFVAAFTVAELGGMLPSGTKSWKKARWYCHLQYIESPPVNKDFARTEVADTEANARAAILVYLIEQGIVKP